MRAIVLAYHDIGCTGIEALLEHGFDIAGVLTHADDPNETAWFRSVAELAARHGLPVFAPKDPNHPLWVSKIRELAPDVLFSFYYRSMLSDEVLAIPKHGSFNLHGSLLPAYRGRAPANWAILNGETETGVTLHHMISRPDAGDIVGQRRVPITPADDARTLNLKLADAARELLGQTLPLIRSGTAPRIPQDESAATYFGKRTPADGVIDWRKPAADIVNLVRAVTRPYPGAFTYTRATKLLVWQAEALKNAARGTPPGQVLNVNPFEVACGDGAVRILFGQQERGVYCGGPQLASDLNVVEGARLESSPPGRRTEARKTRVLILGVNGFIG
ncbi:MAG TPA: formyltransferase, partial [Gammaproteobacteria bacterium]|nr:formyltransferase [Gammaproteobacteria bacterium]